MGIKEQLHVLAPPQTDISISPHMTYLMAHSYPKAELKQRVMGWEPTGLMGTLSGLLCVLALVIIL